MALINPQLSLAANLKALGFTYQPAKHNFNQYAYDILKGDTVVFTGNSQQTWVWIKGLTL